MAVPTYWLMVQKSFRNRGGFQFFETKFSQRVLSIPTGSQDFFQQYLPGFYMKTKRGLSFGPWQSKSTLRCRGSRKYCSVKCLCSMVTLHKQIGCQAPFLNDVQVLSNNPIWQWKFPHTFICKSFTFHWSITGGNFPMQWGPSSTKNVAKTTQLAADGIPGQSAREDLHHATAEHLWRLAKPKMHV